MRFVYASRSPGHYVYVAPVVEPLAELGHEVTMLFHPEIARDFKDLDDLARLCRRPGQSARWIIRRRAWSRFWAEAARNLLTYSSYMTRREQSPYYCRRWEQYLPPPVRWALPLPGVRTWIAGHWFRSRLRRRETSLAPVPGIVEYLEHSKPDAVIASPLNYWHSEEVEYVKAGRRLGIPTALHVFSWDNLTTKSLIYEMPDLLLAWNARQVQEATEIHDVPPQSIVITGAPHFDELFAYRGQGVGRDDFCAMVGLDPKRPYFAYLGSSSFIAADESWLARELAAVLHRHPNPDVRALQMLVRPHPAHAMHYEDLASDSIKVFPRGGGILASPQFIPEFHDTLNHSVAAFGINTSGMLNALVMDKPCITMIAPRYSETQTQAMHFQHLLEADVLEISRSADDCVNLLGRILRGHDDHAAQRRAFVGGWIRPRGLERPAGALVAMALERLAQGQTPAQIDAEIEAGYRAS